MITLSELMTLQFSKQVHIIAQNYIRLCIDDAVLKQKKYISTLIPLKKFLQKQEQSSLYILYEYLCTLECKTVMDLTICFQNARKHQEKLRIDIDRQKQSNVKPYGSYEEYLKEMMEND